MPVVGVWCIVVQQMGEGERETKTRTDIVRREKEVWFLVLPRGKVWYCRMQKLGHEVARY